MTKQKYALLLKYAKYQDTCTAIIKHQRAKLAGCIEPGTYAEQVALKSLTTAERSHAVWVEKYRALYNA